METIIEARLDQIETLLKTLIDQKSVKQHYTTAELAEAVQKSEYTVREWCRHGRLQAQKKSSGRGGSLEWVISQAELERYRQYGLLPLKNRNLEIN